MVTDVQKFGRFYRREYNERVVCWTIKSDFFQPKNGMTDDTVFLADFTGTQNRQLYQSSDIPLTQLSKSDSYYLRLARIETWDELTYVRCRLTHSLCAPIWQVILCSSQMSFLQELWAPSNPFI